MKILIASEWTFDYYEPAFASTLVGLGNEIVKFKFSDYFNSKLGKLQRKYLLNLDELKRLNKELVELVVSENPDVIFLWRAVYVTEDTISLLRSLGKFLVTYNNDNPFPNAIGVRSVIHNMFLWKNYLSSLPLCHLNFVYREKNLVELEDRGIKNIELLIPYYIPDCHYKIEPKVDTCRDGVFVGHYERDQRIDYIDALLQAGERVDLFGPSWNKANNLNIKKKLPVKAVYGNRYNTVLNESKYALCFFSTLNRDTYTRRVFEIPATGTLLVSQYSEDMKKFYKEDQEIILFKNKNELVKKMQYLLRHEDELDEIADCGHNRAKTSGYDIVTRIRQMLDIIYKYQR